MTLDEIKDRRKSLGLDDDRNSQEYKDRQELRWRDYVEEKLKQMEANDRTAICRMNAISIQLWILIALVAVSIVCLFKVFSCSDSNRYQCKQVPGEMLDSKKGVVYDIDKGKVIFKVKE